jgi:hypothetical protein
VTYHNTSEAPDAATRRISFTVSDGTTSAVIARNEVEVIAANDRPVLAEVPETAAYTESGAAGVLAPQLVVEDVDSATLAQATVQIIAGRVAGDVLGIGSRGAWTTAICSALRARPP